MIDARRGAQFEIKIMERAISFKVHLAIYIDPVTFRPSLDHFKTVYTSIAATIMT